MELDHSPDRELHQLSRLARGRLARQSAAFGDPDPAHGLSCLDALLTLHHRVMRPQDRFLLARRSAALALEATLWTVQRRTADLVDVRFMDGRDGPLVSSRAEGLLASWDASECTPRALASLLSLPGLVSPGRLYVLVSAGDFDGCDAVTPPWWDDALPGGCPTVLVDCTASAHAGHPQDVHVDGSDHLALAAALRAHPGGVICLHTAPHEATLPFDSAYAC